MEKRDLQELYEIGCAALEAGDSELAQAALSLIMLSITCLVTRVGYQRSPVTDVLEKDYPELMGDNGHMNDAKAFLRGFIDGRKGEIHFIDDKHRIKHYTRGNEMGSQKVGQQ